jgi:hypothetical protein
MGMPCEVNSILKLKPSQGYPAKLEMGKRYQAVKEREARLDLNEGVIGYTFLRNQKHCIEFIDVSPNARLPTSYKPLSGENATLINRDIQAVLVAAMFEEGSVAGLLAIDTYEIDNIPKMEDNLLHDTALDWVIERSNVIRLIWRVSNDI